MSIDWTTALCGAAVGYYAKTKVEDVSPRPKRLSLTLLLLPLLRLLRQSTESQLLRDSQARRLDTKP